MQNHRILPIKIFNEKVIIWKQHFATSKKCKSYRGVWMDCCKRWCKLSHNPPEMNKWRIITFWSLPCLSRDVKSPEYSFEWCTENTEVLYVLRVQVKLFVEKYNYASHRFAIFIVPPLFIKNDNVCWIFTNRTCFAMIAMLKCIEVYSFILIRYSKWSYVWILSF